jgi:uncharacterized protein (TIGR03382 family)
MVWRTALACLLVAAMSREAAANGRPPATSSINFRQGNDNEIAIGLTFGLVLSHDGGKTWSWMCEDAIGYKGMYDPHYAYSTTGALFASTFVGLKAMRNGCTFDATAAGTSFVSAETLGSDHAFFYAASDPGDASATPPTSPNFKIFRSADDGMTFPMPSVPTATVTWWQTIVVAPSNPQIVYLSGYAYVPGATPDAGMVREHLLFHSINAGAAWTALSIADLTLMPNSTIDVVGVENDNPANVYIRVELDDNTLSDSIYRSTNSGMSWGKIDHKATSIPGFVVRAATNSLGHHDLVVATQSLGSEVSHDNGATWTPLTSPPHITCLTENIAGELWACTQNYGFNGAPSDDAGVMKTTDLAAWTKVLRYQDLTDAVTCAAGTPQQDSCVTQWCAVCAQLGCTPPASYSCPAISEAPVMTTPPKSGGGCCDAGSSGAGALALGLVIGTVVLRPRRRTAA